MPDARANILLVDDRPQNLLALQAILEPLGQNLVLARSGKDALKHLLNTEFAVILLDVLMPEMDGFETAALIKGREQTRAIPIIFLTAINTQDQHVFQGYSIGAVDYISKPFNPDILRSKVLVFVELFSKNQQIKYQAEQLHRAQEHARERALADLRRESDRRYVNLAESLPQIVWSASPDGAITYCNRAAITADAGGAGPWSQLVHPDQLAQILELWTTARATGKEFEAELRVQTAPGAVYRWHLVRVLPVRAEGSTSTGPESVSSWIGTCTDIEDRRRVEDALRFLSDASTQLTSSFDFRTTIARVAEIAVQSIADWCVVDVCLPGAAPERLAIAHADPDDAETARELRAEVLRDCRVPDKRGTFEEFLCGADASADELASWRARFGGSDCVSAPLVLRGAVIGRVALAMTGFGRTFGGAPASLAFGPAPRSLIDHLARKLVTTIDNALLHEAARTEHARLEQANRAKDQFLAVVSHELRTPLNAVLGWAQLMRIEGLDAETAQRGLESIERNAKAQERLISDLLDMSRIISGRIQLDTRSLDLSDIVASVVDSARPEAEQKGLRLNLHAPGPCGLLGDAQRLSQVTWNLLSNAIKFTPPGGEIAVRVHDRGECAELEVADTGVGMEAEFLPRAFERFSQDPGGHGRARGGLGLGLSIVHHIVTMHGGTVSARSPGANRGTTVSVSLPRAEAPLMVLQSSSDRRPLASVATSLANLRLLVVEDSDDAREYLQRALQLHGAHVVSVATVADALRALATQGFDALISDIGLPDESGYTLVRRARECGHVLPAIALTAYATEADRQQTLAAGFQAHFAKPLDLHALTSFLRNSLQTV
jgi:PAS domain S-box-containing protein